MAGAVSMAEAPMNHKPLLTGSALLPQRRPGSWVQVRSTNMQPLQSLYRCGLALDLKAE